VIHSQDSRAHGKKLTRKASTVAPRQHHRRFTMTIINDYCPTCEESCSDHATICTVCGTELESRPSEGTRVPNPPTYIRPDEFLELQQSNAEMSILVTQLRQRLANLRQQVSDIREFAAALPPEALDPQQARPRTIPTAPAYLSQLPRTRVSETSPYLHEASIKLHDHEGVVTKTIAALTGDVGMAGVHSFQRHLLVTASVKKDALVLVDGELPPRAILLFRRGDNVTFARKAQLAKEAGASAVIMGNSPSGTWPYLMKNSHQVAVEIPVVMVSFENSQILEEEAAESMTISLDIVPKQEDCIICVHSFEANQTLLELPKCHHVFHEACALLWLESHNSCPYCRSALPSNGEGDTGDIRLSRQGRSQQTSVDDIYG
jgi:hypothetical protein